MTETFRTGKTRDVEFRRDQLRNLLRLVEENEDEIVTALAKDMRKVGTWLLTLWFS